MARQRWVRTGFCLALILFGLQESGRAAFVDEEGTLEVIGKAQTRVSIRLQDSEGFTQPIDIKMGDLVQWRNLALIEINHDLMYLTRELDILYPLRALKIRAKYHLVGRFLYEAVYNVGPRPFRDVRDRDKENIDKFKQSYDLWEFYVDLSRGPWFFRIGKQNLAWGETDVFRLLDMINPLDNTFGGPFEDLDDRRIPLWMLRGSYTIGTIGPISSTMIEGFWVPGTWDARVSPIAPAGTAYSAPFPDVGMALKIVHPAKQMSNSRWGVRLMGLLGGSFNFTLAHYKTFSDTLGVRVGVTPGLPVLLSTNDAWQEIVFKDVQITGASFNYCEPRTDIIFRGEFAWFWDEPALIPDDNLKLSDTTIPLPPAIVDLLSDLMGQDLAMLGFDSLPVNPTGGTIPKKDILRFMIGLDKYMWIRSLNKRTTFFLSLQYFGQWVPDYDERMRQPFALYPKPLDFAAIREIEGTFTFLANTNYLNGRITPQMVVAYDIRGAWLVMPSVLLLREPFRFMIQYSAIAGQFTGFGGFRDRDQLTFILTYLFN